MNKKPRGTLSREDAEHMMRECFEIIEGLGYQYPFLYDRIRFKLSRVRTQARSREYNRGKREKPIVLHDKMVG